MFGDVRSAQRKVSNGQHRLNTVQSHRIIESDLAEDRIRPRQLFHHRQRFPRHAFPRQPCRLSKKGCVPISLSPFWGATVVGTS